MKVIFDGDFDVTDLRMLAEALDAIESRRTHELFTMLIDEPTLSLADGEDLIRRIYHGKRLRWTTITFGKQS